MDDAIPLTAQDASKLQVLALGHIPHFPKAWIVRRHCLSDFRHSICSPFAPSSSSAEPPTARD
jgi:hypothetical protein